MKREDCPICKEWRLASLVTTCPICGAKGGKEELDALARKFTEQYRDRHEDHVQFGTPIPPQFKVN